MQTPTLRLLSLLLLLTTIISASPTPALHTRAYRIPNYSKISQARARSNSITDGRLVEFSSTPGPFDVTQPNVASNCTTWRAIGRAENWNQVGIVLGLAGATQRSFLELNPDVPVGQVFSDEVTLSGVGTGIASGICYCFSTVEWPVEGARFMAFEVSMFDWVSTAWW